MSQHDYVINNQGFPATRADLNALADAIKTVNAGTSAPSVTAPFMPWYETDTGKLWRRNQANSAWEDITNVTNAALDLKAPIASPTFTGSFTSTGIDDNATNTAITISSSENVSIGTTNSIEKLYVSGTSGDTRIGLNAPEGSDTEIKFSNAFVVQYSLGHDDATDNFVIGADNVDTPLLSVTKAGVAEVKAGIKFPATQVPSADANTLDDYEEGTWTPTITFGGASVGQTTTIAQGGYVKVGSLVTAYCRLGLSNKGTSTGAAALAGLPFTSYSLAQHTHSAAMSVENVTFSDRFSGILWNSTSSVTLYKTPSGGATGSVNDTDFANNSHIFITISYRV